MKNRPRNPAPKYRSTEEFPDKKDPDENWSFLYKENCAEILEQGLHEEMLLYELSRELDPRFAPSGNPHAFLQDISNGFFPNTPFLKLTKKERTALVAQIRSGREAVWREWFAKNQSIVEWKVVPWLKDRYTTLIEDAAYMAAAEEAEKWSELTPEYFMPSSCPGELGAAAKKNQLLEQCEDPFEVARFTLILQLDFGYPDFEILKEFERVLEQVRKKEVLPDPDKETRGKKKNKHLRLRDLAIWRLQSKGLSFDTAQQYLENKNCPDIKLKTSGWDKAAKRGEALVEEFRARWSQGWRALGRDPGGIKPPP